MLGITFAPILPLGGDGYIFDDENDKPHAEYGLSGGFDYWKRYSRAYDLHLGTQVKYQQYHFHYSPDEHDGYYRFLHFSVPASITYPIPNYSYLFLRFGVALSSANIFQEREGNAGPFKYFTEFKTSWLVYPEIHLGFDFLEEKTNKFIIRAGIDYTFIPIGQMATFKTFISDNGVIVDHEGTFTPNKFQLTLSLYPIWKKKINFLKKGHNCPNPF